MRSTANILISVELSKSKIIILRKLNINPAHHQNAFFSSTFRQPPVSGIDTSKLNVERRDWYFKFDRSLAIAMDQIR